MLRLQLAWLQFLAGALFGASLRRLQANDFGGKIIGKCMRSRSARDQDSERKLWKDQCPGQLLPLAKRTGRTQFWPYSAVTTASHPYALEMALNARPR